MVGIIIFCLFFSILGCHSRLPIPDVYGQGEEKKGHVATQATTRSKYLTLHVNDTLAHGKLCSQEVHGASVTLHIYKKMSEE